MIDSCRSGIPPVSFRDEYDNVGFSAAVAPLLFEYVETLSSSDSTEEPLSDSELLDVESALPWRLILAYEGVDGSVSKSESGPIVASDVLFPGS